MGEVLLPRRMFLWCTAAIYAAAFVSLYLQIPGLYGNEGLLPARRQLPYTKKPLLEQLLSSPTLLWLGPRLGLGTQTAMELLCLVGAVLSLAAMLVDGLRDSVVFFCLWALYLSLYQVGQVFLYFQWDNLLLETGFLCILVAPLTMTRGSQKVKEHDRVTFWLVRWLLFRLMFSSGVVKLTSRCPTWWGLTALTYHYETQCIPTPLAWFAHQLPVWWQKLSVVATFVIEIAGPFLFFSPLRRLRIGAFYLQALLQVLIILSGNYNFFNMLTLTLCLSLLDDQHIHFWLGRPYTSIKKNNSLSESKLWSRLCFLLEASVWSLMILGPIFAFDLKVEKINNGISSSTAFTFHHFNQFLKTVTIPSVWIGILSLTWEMMTSVFRCACVPGFLKRFWGMMQWSVFSAAAASLFAISVVPFSYIEYDSHAQLWPGLRQAYDMVDRFQLVNSYGLFRRMTGVGGRPEVVIEGSYDGVSWTEIEFMYKPGNLSAPPSVVMPHQPRLDWQMWFAALGSHTQAPWFTSLMYRLLQGKQDVTELIQTDVSQYPFHQQPPTYLRAHRYRYWFTEPKADGSFPKRWWKRVYDEEFYPMVHLGNAYLEELLVQHRLVDNSPPRRLSNRTVPKTIRWVRSQIRGVPAHILIWTLLACSSSLCLLRGLWCWNRGQRKPSLAAQAAEIKKVLSDHKPADQNEKSDDQQEEEEEEEEEKKGEEEVIGEGDGRSSEEKVEESDSQMKNVDEKQVMFLEELFKSDSLM